MDDTELVAVIAAAIAAAEGTTTDGFVVRSIKRRNQTNGSIVRMNQEDLKMKNYTITVNGNCI